MLQNKNGSSPFADQEYLRSSSSKNNKSEAFKKKVTAKDIDEFERAFSDEDSDVKVYEGKGLFSALKTKAEAHTHQSQPSQNHTPASTKSEPVEKAAEEPKEDLYAELNIDIDAFLASLGGSATSKNATAASLSKSKPNIETVKSSPVKAASEVKQEASAPAQPAPANKKADETATRNFELKNKKISASASNRTRTFSLSDVAKRKIAEDESVDIKNGVRVLSEDKQSDEAILESAPTGKGKGNILDSITPEKGEDIFVAVDKAVKRKKNLLSQGFLQESVEQARKKEKKKKKEKALLTGKELFAHLAKTNAVEKVQLIFALIVLCISFAITVLPSFYSPGNLLEPVFANGFRVYALINMLLLIAVIAVFYKTYSSAIKSVIAFKPNSDTVLLIITAFVFVHQIAVLFNAAILTSSSNYILVVVFAAAMKSLANYYKSSAALTSLKALMKSGSLQSIQPVENKADADALANGITKKGNPKILYCAKVDTAENLTSGIGEGQNESRFYVFSNIAILLVGFITSLIVYFTTSDNNFFLTVLLSFVCLCSPIMKDTVCAINIYFENLKLAKIGAAATEYDGIHSVGKANGIAMDVSDIFTCDVSSFRVFSTSAMNQNQAALYASAVTMGADCLMGRCFKDFVKELGVSLPVTENIQYEERLGFSAWVDGKRVLLGNREMLVQHSLPAPDPAQEKKRAGKYFVMYLVVEGNLTASFLVNYRVLSDIRKMSGEFNKTGLVLMVTSKDPALTHVEIAKRLGIDMAGVKVLSQKGSDIMTEYRSNKAMRVSSGLVCTRKSKSIMQLIIGAHNIYTSDRLIFDFHILGQAAGMLLLLLSLVLGLPLFRNPFAIILLHTFWSAGSYFISSGEYKNLFRR